MSQDFLQTKVYASHVEERLRKKVKVNLQEWDFTGFIDQLKHPTTGVMEKIKAPETMVKQFKDAGSFLGTLQLAQEKAALSGHFIPADLFSRRTKAKEKKEVLTALAAFCSITKTRVIKWQLNKQKRTEILQQLIAENRLISLLQGSLPVTNEFGKMLRKLLNEQDHLDVDKLSQTSLLTLVNVLETLEEVSFPKPSLTELRGKIRTKKMLDEYTAISVDFIGRETELKSLHAFLEVDPNNMPNKVSEPAVILTGLGGVGKSTLIAKFVREVLDADAATVAILDFDRPGINIDDQPWIAEEILRQLSEQNPMLQEGQAAAIANIKQRDDRILQKSVTSDKFEGSSVSQQLLALVGEGIFAAGKQNKPFLLVLDTLEEITQKSASEQLFEWINTVVDMLSPVRVVIIFSGRLFDDQLKQFQRLSYVRKKTVEVNQFDTVIASHFLRKQGLSDTLSDKIARSELLPLRPLELKLIARVLKDGDLSFGALKRELSKKSNKGQELFAGVIYRRVLMRIPDKDVRAIAYPGLILRYITPALVRHVLQPALGLKEMTMAEAEETVKKLAKFSWLTYKSGQDQVWHRKDLRRSMLRLMIAQQPDKAESIRENAILYFQSGTTAEDKSEELYHRLMGVRSPKDGEDFELSQLKAAYRSLQPDSADFSEHARVLLDYASNIDLTPAELPFLPNKYFAKAYERTGRSLLTSRKFRPAYQLYLKGKRLYKYGGLIVTHDKKQDLLSNWENETIYAMAEWKELERRGNVHDFSYQTSLTDVVTYIFPYSLTHPGKINSKFLGAILRDAANQKIVTGSGTSASTIQSMLQRIATCMVLLKKNKKLSPDCLKSLRVILMKLEDERMAPVTKNSLLLLKLVAYDRLTGEYVPDVSSVSFDMPWLRQLINLNSRDLTKSVHNIEDMFLKFGSKPVAINKFSSEFYSNFSKSLTQKKGYISIPVDKLTRKQAYELLKGPDTIFVAPATYALADAFRTTKDWRLLSEIFSTLAINIQDFEYEKMLPALRDNKDLAIERYVEFIDKFWRVGDLLTLAAKAKPGHAKLNNVLKSYRAWQSALQSLFLKTA